MKDKIKRFVPQFLKNYYHLGQSFGANAKNRFPHRKLKIIGVTGTDGKTTTVNLIYHLLKSIGYKVSMISTVNAVIGEEKMDTGFHVTSPDPWLIPKYLRKAIQAGSEYIVLEVTSHALDQHRMGRLTYDIGVLTNISPEHLDYHKTYKRYLKAKTKLLTKSKISILNSDDQSYSKLKLKSNAKVIRYGLNREADIQATNVIYDPDQTQFVLSFDQTKLTNILERKKLTKKKIMEVEFTSPLLGDYNVSNLIAALGTCLSLGVKASELIAGVRSIKTISGRLEEMDIGEDFRVIIDFAHTPGSYQKLLPLARKLVEEKKGKVIHVFGAAGERDHKKRPLMGEISASYADLIVLTAEDPRGEDVIKIIEEIEKGCRKGGAKKADYKKKISSNKKVYFVIPDRQEAISFAIKGLANSGDLVLITGKGHERSMCFGKREYPWSDHQAVENTLK